VLMAIVILPKGEHHNLTFHNKNKDKLALLINIVHLKEAFKSKIFLKELNSKLQERFNKFKEKLN